MDCFDQMDVDRSESIDRVEFQRAFKEVGLPPIRAFDVFSEMDKDMDGLIDREEWLMLIDEAIEAKAPQSKAMINSGPQAVPDLVRMAPDLVRMALQPNNTVSFPQITAICERLEAAEVPELLEVVHMLMHACTCSAPLKALCIIAEMMYNGRAVDAFSTGQFAAQFADLAQNAEHADARMFANEIRKKTASACVLVGSWLQKPTFCDDCGAFLFALSAASCANCAGTVCESCAGKQRSCSGKHVRSKHGHGRRRWGVAVDPNLQKETNVNDSRQSQRKSTEDIMRKTGLKIRRAQMIKKRLQSCA